MQNLQEENAGLKKQIESLLKDKAKNLKGDLKNEFEDINGINFLAKKVDLDASGMKDLCFNWEVRIIIFLFCLDQNRTVRPF